MAQGDIFPNSFYYHNIGYEVDCNCEGTGNGNGGGSFTVAGAYGSDEDALNDGVAEDAVYELSQPNIFGLAHGFLRLRKALLLIFLFVLGAVLFANAQTKGFGVMAFNTKTEMNAVTANERYGSEWAYVLEDSTFYRWSRTTSLWVRYSGTQVTKINSASDTSTIVAPIKGDIAYVNESLSFIRNVYQWLPIIGTDLTVISEYPDRAELIDSMDILRNELSRELVPVILFLGESNSGGQADNADLSATDIDPFPGIKIYNIYKNKFEVLHVGVNNQINHYNNTLTDSIRLTDHGWEVGLQHDYKSYGQSSLYLVKGGQGGSTVDQWEATDTFAILLQQKINGARAQLRAQNKEPVWYIWFSFGINDALAATDTLTFKDNTLEWLERVRDSLHQNAPVFATEISDMGISGFPSYDRQLDTLASIYDWFYIVPTVGLGREDNNHWNYIGMDTIARRMGRYVRDTIGLPYDRGTIVMPNVGTGGATVNTQNYIPVAGAEDFVDSPLYYNSADAAIYQDGTTSGGNTNLIHRFGKGNARIDMSSLLGKVSYVGIFNTLDNIEAALLAGTVGSVFAFGSGSTFNISRYNAGTILNGTFAGETTALRVNSDGTSIHYFGSQFNGNITTIGASTFKLGLGNATGAANVLETNNYNSFLLANNLNWQNSTSGQIRYVNTSPNLGGAGLLYTGTATINGAIPPYSLAFINQQASVTAAGTFSNSIGMLLRSTGNLGVRTISPQRTLHVNGGIRINPDSLLAGTAVGSVAYNSDGDLISEGIKPGGSGTTNRTALWTASNTLGDSWMQQNTDHILFDDDKGISLQGASGFTIGTTYSSSTPFYIKRNAPASGYYSQLVLEPESASGNSAYSFFSINSSQAAGGIRNWIIGSGHGSNPGGYDKFRLVLNYPLGTNVDKIVADQTRTAIGVDVNPKAWDTSVGVCVYRPASTNYVGLNTATPAYSLDIAGTANMRLAPSTAPPNAAGAAYFSSADNWWHGMNGTSDFPFAKASTATFTAGSMLFAGTSGEVSQYNDGLYWDNTLKKLCINCAASHSFTDPVFANTDDGADLIIREGSDAISLNLDNGFGPMVGMGNGTVKAYAGFIGASVFVSGTNSSHDYLFYTGNSPKMVIKADGNVGIGTTDPSSKFQVNGAASGITSIFRANATTPSDLTQWQNSAGAVLSRITSTGIYQLHDPDQPLGYTAFIMDHAANNVNYPRTYFLGFGHGATTANYAIYAASARATGTTQTTASFGVSTNADVKQASSVQGVMQIQTGKQVIFNSLAENTTKAVPIWFGDFTTPDMVIATSGNVGIGTTDPQRLLHVEGTARITGSAGTGTAVMLRDANGDISNATLGGGVAVNGGQLNVVAPQYAQSYQTGGTNTAISVGTPELINLTTTGTISTNAVTSEFTILSNGTIQYTGANDAVTEIAIEVSATTASNRGIHYYLAINGTVVPNSRSRSYHSSGNYITTPINFIDTDADNNDIYSVYAEPTSGGSASITISSCKIKINKIRK